MEKQPVVLEMLIVEQRWFFFPGSVPLVVILAEREIQLTSI